ncbi:MAG: AI-2E family transporter [Clostridiales bacterium]|nr:AI-2E family transporter [Clostridiales bacterium]
MELSRHNMKRILFLIFAAIALFLGMQNIGVVANSVKFVLGLLTPFLIGTAMAFILYVPMGLFEKRVFFSNHKVIRKIRRPISILCSVLLVSAILLVVIILLVPQIAETIDTLAFIVPQFFRSIPDWIDQFTERFPDFNQWLLEKVQVDWSSVGSNFLGWMQKYSTFFLGSTFSAITYVFGIGFNLVVAFVFAIYVLSSKESLSRQTKKALFAFLPERRATRMVELGQLSHRIFYQFVTGQMLEAVILGALCFIGMLILQIPFALISSILVFITAFIPLFGAFIGTGIAAFMILMVSPAKALWFILFIIILQQFEGNVIYPRVMGSSVGLPAMWILVAVTVGGGLLGIVGMLLSVPVVSIVYTLFRETVDKRLKEKNIDTSRQSFPL